MYPRHAECIYLNGILLLFILPFITFIVFFFFTNRILCKISLEANFGTSDFMSREAKALSLFRLGVFGKCSFLFGTPRVSRSLPSLYERGGCNGCLGHTGDLSLALAGRSRQRIVVSLFADVISPVSVDLNSK